MPKITPFLWFDTQAEEAAQFYTSIFPNSKILNTNRYDKEGAKMANLPADSIMTVEFELNGQPFTALNGGPLFKFSEAISFVVHCQTQPEIDHYWEKLSAYPESEQCGWLKDKFGLSWQIIPDRLAEILSDSDPLKAQKAMAAMLKMKKLDITALEKAKSS